MLLEDELTHDLEGIFDDISTGHRRDGCGYKHILAFFKHFKIIVSKYKIYNCQILDFLSNIEINIDLLKFLIICKLNEKEIEKLFYNDFEIIKKIRLFSESFFMLNVYEIYFDELKKLIFHNVDKFNNLINNHLRLIKNNDENKINFV